MTSGNRDIDQYRIDGEPYYQPVGDEIALYEAAYGELPPAPFHAHAYDAYNVILDAVYEAGVLGPDGTLWVGRKALNDAVRATSGYQGLSGVITCDANGNCGLGRVDMFKVVDGEFVAQ